MSELKTLDYLKFRQMEYNLRCQSRREIIKVVNYELRVQYGGYY